jgi:hypothetical protein
VAADEADMGSHRSHRRRRLVLACLALGLLAVPAVIHRGAPVPTVSVALPVSAPEPSYGGVSADEADLLGRSRRGADAIARLGDDLAVAAARNGMTAERVRTLLRSDRSAWLDPDGRIFYQEAGAPATPAAKAASSRAAAYPDWQTFRLHSRPGSQRTIYLDFDGGTVRDTVWNQHPIGTEHPAWDLDGDPSSFGPAEQAAVQRVWQSVAEDFAPFDVDVTTEDPGVEALTRTSATDETYGAWVLISPSRPVAQAVCGGGCGGIAYLRTFNQPGNARFQPAWVFPQALGDDPKNVAEAATHEVGHNLGLEHDGETGSSYYAGRGSWAPIMGAGYNRPVTQWNDGDYAGASQHQDDVVVIEQHGLDRLLDDHGDSVSTATTVGVGATDGLIGTRADVDVLAVRTTCPGPLSATVEPAVAATNLDLALRLLSAEGATLATDDPVTVFARRDAADGLSARVATQAEPGTYYLEVGGVGVAGPAGWSDYGSLGRYTLTVAACSDGSVPDLPGDPGVPDPELPGGPETPEDPGAPTEPTVVPAADNLRVTVTRTEVTLRWAVRHAALVRHYRVRAIELATGAVARTRIVPAGERSLRMRGLERGTRYRFDVAAVSADGVGPTSAPVRAGLPAAPPPSRLPTITMVRPGAPGGRVTALVRWREPRTASRRAAYRVIALPVGHQGRKVQRARTPLLERDRRGAVVVLPARGRYVFVVRAVAGNGDAVRSRQSRPVHAR